MPSQLTLAFIGSVWVLLLAELVRRACGQCRRTAWDLKVKRANRVQKCAGASAGFGDPQPTLWDFALGARGRQHHGPRKPPSRSNETYYST